MTKNKKAQEEMVGFALIIVLVAVIFIVFIASYIKKSPEITEDYKANSFVQALLQYTTNCEEENLNNLTVQKLIFKCHEGNPCYYRTINSYKPLDSCKVLNDTIKNIIKESWKVGPKNPVKGYSFIINVSETEQLLNLVGGVVTNNYRGGEQDFGKGGEYIIILFNVYS